MALLNCKGTGFWQETVEYKIIKIIPYQYKLEH